MPPRQPQQTKADRMSPCRLGRCNKPKAGHDCVAHLLSSAMEVRRLSSLVRERKALTRQTHVSFKDGVVTGPMKAGRPPR